MLDKPTMFNPISPYEGIPTIEEMIYPWLWANYFFFSPEKKSNEQTPAELLEIANRMK